MVYASHSNICLQVLATFYQSRRLVFGPARITIAAYDTSEEQFRSVCKFQQSYTSFFLPEIRMPCLHCSVPTFFYPGFVWRLAAIRVEIGWEFQKRSWRVMRKSFKDSLKALEADIQHANTLASDYPREYDGACLQMRLSYSPCAHIFLFLVQWTDCHLAGALGLIRILIYKAYKNGKTTMYIHERKASLREFYGVIFPSLLQLHGGITDSEERKQREIFETKYKRKTDKGKLSEIEIEREEECGICMEMNTKVVLPNCSHSLCMKCYRDWRARSQSCPFCRDCLKRMDSGELWIYTSNCDIIDLSSYVKENLKRLFKYVEKLPLIVPDPKVVSHDPHY